MIKEGGDANALSTSAAGETEETGLTESDDFENFEEETEEAFLLAASSAIGGANAPSNNNQISKKNCAMGPKTESVKNPCNVIMIAEKPSIA